MSWRGSPPALALTCLAERLRLRQISRLRFMVV